LKIGPLDPTLDYEYGTSLPLPFKGH